MVPWQNQGTRIVGVFEEHGGLPITPPVASKPLPSTLAVAQNRWAVEVTAGRECELFVSTDGTIAGFCINGIGGPKPKKRNEDSVLVQQREHSKRSHLLVIDGMGGANGFRASEKLIFVARDGLTRCDDIADAMRGAPSALLADHLYSGGPETMGAVFAGTTIDGSTGLADIALCGDCQYLRVTPWGEVGKVSVPHSIQNMSERGIYDDADDDEDPTTPVCMVGIIKGKPIQMNVEKFQDRVKRGDKIILGSDGLFNLCDLKTLAKSCSVYDRPEEFARALLEELKDHGSKGNSSDNIACVIHFPEGNLNGKYRCPNWLRELGKKGRSLLGRMWPQLQEEEL